MAAMDLTANLLWNFNPLQHPEIASVPAFHFYATHAWDITGHWILPILLWVVAIHKNRAELFSPSFKGDGKK